MSNNHEFRLNWSTGVTSGPKYVHNYYKFKEMHRWFKERETAYDFQWNDTGRFLPDYIVIFNNEDALAFRLQYYDYITHE